MRIVLFALLALPAAAGAQQVYKCGSTYQAQPCDGGKQLNIKAAGPSADGAETCRKDLGFWLKDAESAKVQQTVLPLGYKPLRSGTPAVGWSFFINAKGEGGGYTGWKEYVCYTTPDGTQSLAFHAR